MSGLENMPPEVFCMIADYLTPGDVRNMRLVHSGFRAALHEREYQNFSIKLYKKDSNASAEHLESSFSVKNFKSVKNLYMTAAGYTSNESETIYKNLETILSSVNASQLKSISFKRNAVLDASARESLCHWMRQYPKISTFVNPARAIDGTREGRHFTALGFYTQFNGKHLFAREGCDAGPTATFIESKGNSKPADEIMLFGQFARSPSYRLVCRQLSRIQWLKCPRITLVQCRMDYVFRQGINLMNIQSLHLVGCDHLLSWLHSKTQESHPIPLKSLKIVGRFQKRRSFVTEDEELGKILEFRSRANHLRDLYLDLPYSLIQTPPSVLVGQDTVASHLERLFIRSDNHEISLKELEIILSKCPQLNTTNVELQRATTYEEKTEMTEGLCEEMATVASSLADTNVTEVAICIRLQAPLDVYRQWTTEVCFNFVSQFWGIVSEFDTSIQNISIIAEDPGFREASAARENIAHFFICPSGKLHERDRREEAPFCYGPPRRLEEHLQQHLDKQDKDCKEGTRSTRKDVENKC